MLFWFTGYCFLSYKQILIFKRLPNFLLIFTFLIAYETVYADL
jgi:hypothetical protein